MKAIKCTRCGKYADPQPKKDFYFVVDGKMCEDADLHCDLTINCEEADLCPDCQKSFDKLVKGWLNDSKTCKDCKFYSEAPSVVAICGYPCIQSYGRLRDNGDKICFNFKQKDD